MPRAPFASGRRPRRCARRRRRSRRCRRWRSRSSRRRGRSASPSARARAGHRRDVGAGVGLGERERGDRLAARDARQVARASARRVPARLIAPEPRPCIAKAKSARPSWRASVSRARQIARVSIASAAPPCARPATAWREPAACAERAHERAAGGVDVGALAAVRMAEVRPRPRRRARPRARGGAARRTASRGIERVGAHHQPAGRCARPEGIVVRVAPARRRAAARSRQAARLGKRSSST